MKRVLFIQNYFNPPGGANTVANWLLQALKDEFKVTALTWEPVDWQAVNRYYGTSLDPAEFRVIYPSPWVRALLNLDPDPRSIQPEMYLTRMGKRLRRHYHVCLSADYERDFGGPGIQYIHYPGLIKQYQQPQLPTHASVAQQIAAVVRGQYRPWQMFSQ